MPRMEALPGRSDLRAYLTRTRSGGRLLAIHTWIPSEVKAISPLVDRLMRLIEGSHCIVGEEGAVELALSEAMSNAVVFSVGFHIRFRDLAGFDVSRCVRAQITTLERMSCEEFSISWALAFSLA